MRFETPHAVRVLTHNRGFSICVILSLGVGISSATGVMAIVDSVRRAPLPFKNADRVEQLFVRDPASPNDRTWQIPREAARAVAAAGSPIEETAGYQYDVMLIRDREHVVSALGANITVNYPRVLGSRMILGRAIDSADANGTPAVMLSETFWAREFGSDSSVVGRSMVVNGMSHTVVGVASRTWDFPERTSLWTSDLSNASTPNVARRPTNVLALLTPGASQVRARGVLGAAGTVALRELGPRHSRDVVSSESMRDVLTIGRFEGAIVALTLIAIFVGFLTAVNFAGLVLARGIRRRGELGVRAALGASVPRLARYIIGENLLLCAIGGLVAALLAPAVVGIFRASFASMLPAWMPMLLSYRTVVTGVALSVAIGLVFGLGPAFDLARPALTVFLQSAGSTITSGVGLARTRAWLVAIQVALATGLLITLGALLGRSLSLSQPAIGFPYDPIVIGHVGVDSARQKVDDRWADVSDRVRQLPGVGAAALIDSRLLLPAEISSESSDAGSAGRTSDFQSVWWARSSESVFGVVRPTVVTGRLPTAEEFSRQASVAVISRVAAQRLFDDNAVGKTLRLSRQRYGQADLRLTVIGVVDDLRREVGPAEGSPVIFTPPPRDDVVGQREVWIRASGPVQPLLRLARTHASTNQLGTLVFGFHSLADEIHAESSALWAAMRITLLIFCVALGLAALGIFGLVAYTAETRGRELAIREALGASRRKVTVLLLQSAAIQAAIGLAVGGALGILGAAYLGGRLGVVIAPAIGTTAFTSLLVVLTIFASSLSSLRRLWRRDLSAALRV